LAKVFHYDLYGDRDSKYDFLQHHNIRNTDFEKLELAAPQYFFVQKDFRLQRKYEKGFSVNSLFSINSVGIVTSRDSFVTDDKEESLTEKIKAFFVLDAARLRLEYGLKENRSWKIDLIRNKARCFDGKYIQAIAYRPFDRRYVYYEPNFIERSRNEVMRHFLKAENAGLALCRQFKTGDQYVHSFITKQIIESSYVSNRTSEITSVFPLYLCHETSGQQTFDDNKKRKPNLDTNIVRQIAKSLKLTFAPDKEDRKNTFSPMDILDYIYAVLHSPTYREKYKEFLKTDFPRVPYPIDQKRFRQIVRLGGELRTIHLLENPKVGQFVTSYPKDGDNVISRKIVKKDFEITDRKKQLGRVWISDEQYFGNMPKAAWEFHIGGYQPAQKWLKDRKGRELSSDDILHYQKIIVALSETGKLMRKIDKTDFMHKGTKGTK